MSKAIGISMLKRVIVEHGEFDMIGFKREYLEMIIKELEKE